MECASCIPVTYIVECFSWLRITNFDTLANHFHVKTGQVSKKKHLDKKVTKIKPGKEKNKKI